MKQARSVNKNSSCTLSGNYFPLESEEINIYYLNLGERTEIAGMTFQFCAVASIHQHKAWETKLIFHSPEDTRQFSREDRADCAQAPIATDGTLRTIRRKEYEDNNMALKTEQHRRNK